MAWTHVGGDAGRSGFADVAPLETEPRRLWTAKGTGLPSSVIASEDAVVVGSEADEKVAVLDPGTGEIRYELRGKRFVKPVLAGATVLVARASTIFAHDLVSGHEVWSSKQKAAVWRFCCVGEDLLVGAGETVSRLVLADAAPRLAWSSDLGGPPDTHTGPLLLALPELVLAERPMQSTAFDRTSGKPRFHLHGQLVRAGGQLIVMRGSGRIGESTLHGLDGKGVTVEECDVFAVPAPSLIVGISISPLPWRDEDQIAIRVIDPRSGARRDVGDPGYSVRRPEVVMARDVLYVTTDYGGDGAYAVRLDGQYLWGFDPESKVCALVPMEHKLIVATERSVVCLGSP